MAMQLPHWHVEFSSYPTERIHSGCPLVKGNITCSVSKLQSIYQAALQDFGSPIRLTQDHVSLARYIATEVGSGTPEEKVAVAEAAVNRSRIWGMTPDQLLRNRQKPGHPNRGFYGPIHGPGGAPYGRWAGTKRDPSIQDLLIVDKVLKGQTKNFARDADDQFGPRAGVNLGLGTKWPERRVKALAEKGNYWVGLLPGVDHRKTFLVSRKPIPKAQRSEILKRSLIAVNQSPDWSHLPIERPPRMKHPLAQVILGAGLVALVTAVYKVAAAYKYAIAPVPLAEMPDAALLMLTLKDCPACETLAPKFNKVAASRGVSVAQVNGESDVGTRLCDKLGIEMFPAVYNQNTGQVWQGVIRPESVLGTSVPASE